MLGKHYPVVPSRMEEVHRRLADKIQLDGPTVVIGLAETATGLGHGVFVELLRHHDVPMMYQLQLSLLRMITVLIIQ